MKILHIGNLKSGIDTYVRNTVSLAGDDFDFVIVSGADDNSKPYLRKEIPVRNYRICLYRALNPIEDVKAIIQTIRIVKKEKPDVMAWFNSLAIMLIHEPVKRIIIKLYSMAVNIPMDTLRESILHSLINTSLIINH